MMILIVEDNDIILDFLRRALETWGYICEIATDGETAVSKARATRYDLVMMDLMLTGMDGVAAARVIRDDQAAASRASPIVVLTGGLFKASVTEIDAAEFDAIIQKPIRIDELKAIVERFAGKVGSDGAPER